MADPMLAFTPATSRACSRCHSRKVKTLEAELQSYRLGFGQEKAPPPLGHENSIPQDAEDIRSLAEEVGSLALGGNRNATMEYVGSASGATFTKIFFRQLGFKRSNLLNDPEYPEAIPQSGLDDMVIRAGLPSPKVAEFLLSSYISNIHIWWPLLDLSTTRIWLRQMFKEPARCHAQIKFFIFIIFALGAHESATDPEYLKMRDIYSPKEYFATCSQYYENISYTGRDLRNVQACLLLTLWMLRSLDNMNYNNLWQMSRLTMSIAIEIGCHRNNPRWKLGTAEQELRNRVFWCTFGMERMIAVFTGRVLSIRNHAIDAPFPRAMDSDTLTRSQARGSPTLELKGLLPAIHMFRLRRIAGDVLESVYIARPAANSKMDQIYSTVDRLRGELIEWMANTDKAATPGSKEHMELVIEHSLTVLILNRPSPTFIIPSPTMLAACQEASDIALKLWTKLLISSTSTSVINFRTFKDILITGVAGLYCAWRSPNPSSANISDTSTMCLDLLDRACRERPSLIKYRHLYAALVEATMAACEKQAVLKQSHQDLTMMLEPLDAQSANAVDAVLGDVSSVMGWNTADSSLDDWLSALMADPNDLVSTSLDSPGHQFM
ncbi:MAG: hypothetical protein M1834_000527 [Cirrosporium novae-zelandiae]|nr:MAG: hypothetical protein M1834_000527 [Cirrosporium novae-zelandiae]